MRRYSFITLAVTIVATALCGCKGQMASIGGPSPETTPLDPNGIVVPSGTLERSSKVDLLLMIDDSSSMHDKQERLRKAIPDLVMRLVAPNCVDAQGRVLGRSQGGACAAGTLEFAPVEDLHVGVLTSSLGGRGGDVCGQDDRAHLVTRTADGSPLADAPLGFLDFGSGPGKISDPARLQSGVDALVAGVGSRGCGLEAQLESWYRFLVQPDPYDTIAVDPSTNIASLQGVDLEVLKQRKSFLRPDSLLSLVILTDEDDSTVDPLSLGGFGWAYATNRFPGSPVFRSDGATTTAARPTSACEASPLSRECSSCAFRETCMTSPGTLPGVPCDLIVDDAACAERPYHYPEHDSLSTRFFHMKRRFGVDPQFPLARYVHGLLSARVPSRLHEHDGSGSYVETPECTNPIYATGLPSEAGDERCHLATGPRSQKLVVLSVIAGAPPELLHPGMTSQDWVTVLGNDPTAYAFQGMDPHMIQSVTPRAGLPGPGANDDADPVHGRERETGNSDLQYACTFALDAPRACRPSDGSCDCGLPQAPGRAPICDDAVPSLQVGAKAYPGIRPLQLARLLGENAVAASTCPPRGAPETSASLAYRPAMLDLGDRMARSLVLAAP